MAKKKDNKGAAGVLESIETPIDVLPGKSYYDGNTPPDERIKHFIAVLKGDPRTLNMALEMEELLPEYLGHANDLGASNKRLQIDLAKFRAENDALRRQVKTLQDNIVSLKTRLGEL